MYITRSTSGLTVESFQAMQCIILRTFCEDIQSLFLLFLAHEGVSRGYRGVREGSQPLLLLTVPLCLTLPQTREE